MSTNCGVSTMGQMRVLHVVDTLGVGGTELGLANLIERSQEQIVHLVCCIRAAGATAIRLERAGVDVMTVGKRPGFDWSLALRIARVCRTLKPHIVHTRNWGSIDGTIGARLARVPVVIHGEHGRHADDVDGTNRRRNRVRRAFSPFIDRVVTVSEHLQRWLVKEVLIAPAKISVVRNGVDITRFQPPASREWLRSEEAYGPGEFLVGTVGRLDPVKNQACLVEAISLLADRHTNMRLVVVGDGPEEAVLQAEVRRRGLAGIARLVGRRDDIPAWLGRLDVFVLPSLAEGMCNTILEAMAVGLPVVATRVGGNPELVVDGVTGMLVPTRDPDALAQAVGFYGSNETVRRKHGAAGRARVLQHFPIEQMVDRYVSLYHQELARRGWEVDSAGRVTA